MTNKKGKAAQNEQLKILNKEILFTNDNWNDNNHSFSVSK
jgi:hypothetical protein